jgi:ribosomal protein S27AE
VSRRAKQDVEEDQDDGEDDEPETDPEPVKDVGLPTCDSCHAPIPETELAAVVCVRCAPGVPFSAEDDHGDREYWYSCRLCGRTGLPLGETRVLCRGCLSRTRTRKPPADLRTERERSLSPRELKRRTSKGRCVDLCGRELEPGSRSPRCKWCLAAHRRRLSGMRQRARRRRLRDKTPDKTGRGHVAPSTRAGTPRVSGDRDDRTSSVTRNGLAEGGAKDRLPIALGTNERSF